MRALLLFSVAKNLVKTVKEKIKREKEDGSKQGEEPKDQTTTNAQIVTDVADSESNLAAPGPKKRCKVSRGIKKGIMKDEFGRAYKYGCQMCQKYIVYTAEELGHHINMKHYKLKRFYCYKCGKGRP